MKKILKYIGIFCLLSLAASLTFCGMGVYQGMQTANRLFAGADNYTCREFLYDVTQPDTDKLAPLVIATISYGSNPGGGTEKSREDEVMNHGMEPAVRKVYQMCQGKPAERVLNLFTAATTGVSLTIVSATATVSGTAVTSTSLPTSPQ